MVPPYNSYSLISSRVLFCFLNFRIKIACHISISERGFCHKTLLDYFVSWDLRPTGFLLNSSEYFIDQLHPFFLSRHFWCYLACRLKMIAVCSTEIFLSALYRRAHIMSERRTNVLLSLCPFIVQNSAWAQRGQTPALHAEETGVQKQLI